MSLGSPESRYAKGYIDMDLDVDHSEVQGRIGDVGLLTAVGTMDAWLWLDALEHLGEISGKEWFDDAKVCRSVLMSDTIACNENFASFVRWQEKTIANLIVSELGFRNEQENNTHGAPSEGGCNVTSIIEYLHRHFYGREKVELKQGIDENVLSLWLVYPPNENNARAEIVVLARSNDPLRISRIVASLDLWGKDYAVAMTKVDKDLATVKGHLERFHYYLRNIIRSMQFFPHRLKAKCSIEKTLDGKRAT